MEGVKLEHEIGSYRFFKNKLTNEIFITNEKFTVLTGIDKGINVNTREYDISVKLPNKVIHKESSSIYPIELKILFSTLYITVYGDNHIISTWDNLDLFTKNYSFIDDEDYIDTEKPDISNIGDYEFYEFRGDIFVTRNNILQHSLGLNNNIFRVFDNPKLVTIPKKAKSDETERVIDIDFNLDKVGNLRVIAQGSDVKITDFLEYFTLVPNEESKQVINKEEHPLRAKIGFGTTGLGNYTQILGRIDRMPSYAIQKYMQELRINPYNSRFPTNNWREKCDSAIATGIALHNKIADELFPKEELKLLDVNEQEELMKTEVFKMKLIN